MSHGRVRVDMRRYIGRPDIPKAFEKLLPMVERGVKRVKERKVNVH